jgi:p-cumate 2,3-dioxygenase subunit alpha
MNVDTFVLDKPGSGSFSVNRASMTSLDVFRLEQVQIFDHSWLYVGHATEIPEPGDFRRRSVGGRPLIFIRGSDGVVRAFFNTCTHRGAQVCRQDSGRAQVFQCFYHAWSFNNSGTLVGVPDEIGYSKTFSKADFGLQSPCRFEEYRGLYFVSFDDRIVDLETYLGPVKEFIDETLDSAEGLGGWTVLSGSAQYSIGANWKLLLENSFDGYHYAAVHQTYVDYMAYRSKLNGKENVRGMGVSTVVAAGRGHAAVLFEAPGRGIANPSPVWNDEANDAVERLKSETIARYGEKRGRRMCEYSRQLLIYPNLAFQDTQSGFRLRVMSPGAPDRVDVSQWELVPREESAMLRAARMEMSLAFLGPGGLATPDDVEALESCQRGFAAREVAWSDISRGLEQDVPQVVGELQMRAFWRQWQAHLRGDSGAINTADGPKVDSAAGREALEKA